MIPHMPREWYETLSVPPTNLEFVSVDSLREVAEKHPYLELVFSGSSYFVRERESQRLRGGPYTEIDALRMINFGHPKWEHQ